MEDQLTLSPVAYYEGRKLKAPLSLHRRIGCGKRSAVWKAFPICG